MAEVKKILVALAFSSYSEGIFRYAAGLAAQLGADLMVASIINDRDVAAVRRIADMGYDVDGQDYINGIKAERHKSLEQLIRDCGVSAERVQTVFKVGHPTDELLKMIVSDNVDMVVMGTKGRTDLEHAFFGSVAEKIFRRSPVTVVSYRDEGTAQRLRKRIQA